MYDLIKDLCTERGITIAKMCNDCGMSPTVMSELKHGRTQSLSAPTVRKIADYFGVSPNYILTGEADKEIKKQPTSGGDELIEILDACRERSDLRMLFKLSKDATPDDVRKAITIIQALKND